MDISYKLRHTIDSLAQQPDQEPDVCVSSDTCARPGHHPFRYLDLLARTNTLMSLNCHFSVTMGVATATIIKSALSFF